MKVSALGKLSMVAGAAVLVSAAWRALGQASDVVLSGTGCAGVLTAKDGKPVGAFAATRMRPHSIAGLTLRTCGWICVASARKAAAKRLKEARQHR